MNILVPFGEITIGGLATANRITFSKINSVFENKLLLNCYTILFILLHRAAVNYYMFSDRLMVIDSFV